MAEPSSHFRGSWRVFAISSGVLNLGLLGAVATVGLLKGIDALSTIALTLAIIAFIAQLVIFAIQTTHSGEQLRAAQHLNAETRGLIGEMRSRVDTTYQMVSSHNEALLKLANLKAETGAPPADVVETEAPSPGARSAFSGVSPLSPSGRALTEEVLRLPSEGQLEEALSTLEELPESAISTFTLDLAGHLLGELQGDAAGIQYGPGDDPLIERGLAEKVESGTVPRLRLTEKGLRLGGLFGRSSPAMTDLEPELRARVIDIREKASPSALALLATLPSL